MDKFVENIFITKKEKLQCIKCSKPIPKGDLFVAPTEQVKGVCFNCSPFVNSVFLPSGDAAMTRRSKKYSSICGVLQSWNQRRRRYERKGQYVDNLAIVKAKNECNQDQGLRNEKNKKAAIKREELDKVYVTEFAKAIKQLYPNCPINRETEIAVHACQKHSGRVGRTASAKSFDKEMIDLAVEAHIRHIETDYDNRFNKGLSKKAIRLDVKNEVKRILKKWS